MRLLTESGTMSMLVIAATAGAAIDFASVNSRIEAPGLGISRASAVKANITVEETRSLIKQSGGGMDLGGENVDVWSVTLEYDIGVERSVNLPGEKTDRALDNHLEFPRPMGAAVGNGEPA